MVFSFNPLLWFVCGSCKEAFPNTVELKEHKLKQHLGDCLRIKRIVFEEKFVDDEWTPLNLHSSAKARKNNVRLPRTKNALQGNNEAQRFQNPYVSLKRLSSTPHSIQTRERITKTGQRPPNLPDVDDALASKSKRNKQSEYNNNEAFHNQASKIPKPILIPSVVPKEEPEECEEMELPLNGATTVPVPFSSTSSFSSTSNENIPNNYGSKDLEDEELIIASVTSTSHGTEVEFTPYPLSFQSGQSNSTDIFPAEITKEENDVELSQDWGFDWDAVNESDFLNTEDSDPLSTSLPSELQPKPEVDSIKRSEDNSESETEQEDLQSEYEPDSVSGSEFEEESNSGSKSNPKKKLSSEVRRKKHLQGFRTKNWSWRTNSTSRKKNQRNLSTLPYACESCPAAFISKGRLKRHRLIHPKITPYKCNYPNCLAACETKQGFQKHMWRHKNNEKHRQSKNSEHSPLQPNIDLKLDLSLLQWLILQEETNPSNFILLQPDPRTSLEFHPVRKTNPVMCKLCEERFVTEKDLRWHVSKCFNYNKGRHRYCRECNKSYFAPNALKIHRRRMHSTKPRESFKCSKCSKEFQKESVCKLHEATHVNVYRDQNQEGNKSIIKILPNETRNSIDIDIPLSQWLILQRETNPSNLILLEPDPTTVADFDVLPISDMNTVQCKLCGETLTSESLLRYHVSNCFLFNKKNHNYCPICDKHFRYLSKHNEITHVTINGDGDGRSYKCGECSEEFSSKKRLIVHENRHKKERLESRKKECQSSSLPYICESCPEAFESKAQLQKHKLIHPRNTFFKCDHPQCLVTCETQHGFLRHILRHKKQQGSDENLEKEMNTNSSLQPDIDLSLLQWLILQEERNPANFILLEPDPRSSLDFQPVSEANPVMCKFCEERFVSELDLRWHVSKCFLYNKVRHRYCRECSKSYFAPNALKIHRRRMHST